MSESTNVTKSAFQFKGYQILKSDLNWNGNHIGREIEFNINPFGEFKENEGLTITLTATVNDKERNLQVGITMVGDFSYKCEDIHKLIQFIGFNAPAIMFPYVRSYISCLTGLSGIAPIVLPTINMEPVGKILVNQLESETK